MAESINMAVNRLKGMTLEELIKELDQLPGDPVTGRVISIDKAADRWWVQIFYDGGKTIPAIGKRLDTAIRVALMFLQER